MIQGTINCPVFYKIFAQVIIIPEFIWLNTSVNISKKKKKKRKNTETIAFGKLNDNSMFIYVMVKSFYLKQLYIWLK